MATSTGVKYIGKNDVYEDNILRTGLTWSKGETHILPEVMAKEFLKHPGMFAEVPGASYLIASSSGSGAAKLSLGEEVLLLRRRVLDAVDSAIAANQSACISVQVDSTGNGPTEWVYMMAKALAAKWSGACVIYQLWNDTNQNYDAPEVIQAGALGERYAYFPANSRSFSSLRRR